MHSDQSEYEFDDDDSRVSIGRNSNYIADPCPANVVQRSYERRSYDEPRKRTFNDSSDDRQSDRSERRDYERGFHPQPRQDINVDAARPRVVDHRYVQQLEEELAEMKNMNKKLKAQVSEFRKSRSGSITKRSIRRDNEWTAEEGRLADKIVPFCKLYLFPRYKFLKDNWMDFDLENENSFCNFVFSKMNEMYPNMRNITAKRREWESVYVPLIGQKYSNMRCNLSNDIRSQYFGKFLNFVISLSHKV